MVLTKSGPTVYTEMIVAGNIEASDLANDAVGSGNIAADGVKASHIAAGAVSASLMAADAIGSTIINADGVKASHIAAGAVSASLMAADAVGSTIIAADGVKGSHLATTALSQVIRVTGPAAGPIRDAGPTGVYSANIGATARFAWARCVGSDRIAKVFSINSNTVRLFVRSINDAGGSARLVDGVSNSITLCWMT